MHEKRAWLIVVDASNQILRFLTSMVVQITHTELKFVNTIKEAIMVLKHVDSTLQAPVIGNVQWITILVE